ncbi:AAA family ATPase [Candidatus Parcubacteria bacterium]|nr:AAA family ATPase [Candidatus Parcubacteria bacterium]
MDKDEIRQKAETFARENRKHIAKSLTDLSRFAPEDTPISIFMAGSPGAGKTEFSKRLIELFDTDGGNKIVRIDPDELRDFIPGYDGNNSYLFQTAVSLITEKIHDLVLINKQSFLLDGTFSKYDKAVDNVKRSISKGRTTFIFYIYQRPEVAWRFTQAREIVEGRHIPKGTFIEQFLGSRDVVEKIYRNFSKQVLVYLVKKDFETHKVENIVLLEPSKDGVEDYLGKLYNVDELEKIL